MKEVTMEELGRIFKVKRKSQLNDSKVMKCVKCGGTMTPHAGTNVFTCENMVEDDNHNLTRCGNYLLRKYIVK